METKITAQNLFSTPLIVGKIDNPGLNEALEKAILANRAEHPGMRRSNIGGWHSEPTLLTWGGKPMKQLAEQVIAAINANTVHVGGENAKFGWRLEAWANVNQRGATNARHVHGGSYWSAVYYVRVDQGEGGRIVLHDLRMPTLAMHAPFLRFRNTGGERDVKIKPEPGMLLIFPAWLPHEVEAWDGDGLRISIAINITAAKGAQPQGAVDTPDPKG